MIADALQRLVEKWNGEAEGYDRRTDEDFSANAMMLRYCAVQLESAVLATVREKPQTPLKLCAGGTHTWTRTTSRWPGPAERCDCGARTWGVQQAEGRAPEPPKGTLSNEDAKHSCPRCEMDLLDCVCPEPAEARVPHEPPAPITALRLAKEAVNAWACYAKRDIEHREITRLHDAIRDLEAQASRPAPPLDAVESYRVEPESDSPEGGDWHVLRLVSGKQIHILTRHPLVIVEPEQH